MFWGGDFFNLFSDNNPIDDFLEQARIKQKEIGEKVQETIVGVAEQIDPELPKY